MSDLMDEPNSAPAAKGFGAGLLILALFVALLYWASVRDAVRREQIDRLHFAVWTHSHPQVSLSFEDFKTLKYNNGLPR